MSATENSTWQRMAPGGESGRLSRIELPKRFSARANKAIEQGIITKSVRCDIVTMTAACMWQVSTNPTPEDYTYICQALIAAYPIQWRSQT